METRRVYVKRRDKRGGKAETPRNYGPRGGKARKRGIAVYQGQKNRNFEQSGRLERTKRT